MGLPRGTGGWAGALGCSALVHLGLLAWLPAPGEHSRSRPSQSAEFVVALMPPPAEDLAEAPSPVEPDLALGIDAPTPPSETWLGHETFEEHLAAPADFDQAAFTTERSAAGQGAESSSNQTESQPPNASPPPALTTPTPQPDVEVVPDESNRTQAPIDESPLADRQETPPDQPDAATIEQIVATLQSLGILFAAQPVDQAPPTPSSPPTRAEAAASPATPPPTVAEISAPQSVSGPASSGEPAVGELSDRQSDPTSIVDVPRDRWRLGQPVAAHGLELKPVKPHLTTLTAMTAAACNPLCELRFNAEGKPVIVRLIEGSCDPRVDEAVISALYRWRARGDELQRLATGQTVSVRIRLILNPRLAGGS